jgi:hypothetical protein
MNVAPSSSQPEQPEQMSPAEKLALKLMVELQEVHHTKPSGTSEISKKIMEFAGAIADEFKVHFIVNMIMFSPSTNGFL